METFPVQFLPVGVEDHQVILPRDRVKPVEKSMLPVNLKALKKYHEEREEERRERCTNLLFFCVHLNHRRE